MGVDVGASDCRDEGEEVGVGGRGWVLGCRWEEMDGADGGNEGDDLDVVGEGEVFLGDAGGGDAACSC